MRFKGGQSDSGQKLPFLKLKDGEKLRGVFRGEPYEFYQVWATKSITPIDGIKPKDASYRFRINFVMREGNQFVSKVWEQGATICGKIQELDATIRKLSKNQQDLERTLVEISRSGSGVDDTEYKIEISDSQPNDKGWSIIDAVALQPLEHQVTKASLPPLPEDLSWTTQDAPPDSFDEIPF